MESRKAPPGSAVPGRPSGSGPVLATLAALLGILAACSESAHRLPSPRPVPVPEPVCKASRTPIEEFRFGIMASAVQSPEDLSVLEGWIGSHLGIRTRIEVFDRYEELGARMLQRTLEAAVLPPLEYVETNRRDPCIRARLTSVVNGAVRYSSFLVTRKDSRIRRLEDLRGARGAFVSPDSASGWLFAWRRLQEAGLDPWRDLSEVRFLGSHAAVIEAVILGESDVGATFDQAILAARRQGWDTGSLSLVALGGRIPYDALVVSPEVPADLTETFLAALTRLDTTTVQGRAILAALGNLNGLVPTDDSFYDDVRRVAEAVLLDKGGSR